MTYLDNGATSLRKPDTVYEAVRCALENCANPGRGGYRAAMTAARTVLRCRERAAKLFDCKEEQVVFTANCTQGLNTAMRTLIRNGEKVAISGFEHNAVTRTLHGIGAKAVVAGRRLFDPGDTLTCFENALRQGVSAAVFSHVSNVFGYILPVSQMAALCRMYRVPFVIDAAQSAGVLPLSLQDTGADFIAMPGHKGLLGPMGTGLLLCADTPKPLLYGGTGSRSESAEMPDFLPDAAEAGTLNVPGIAGLSAALEYLAQTGLENIFRRENRQLRRCVRGLRELGVQVFAGEEQCATVSFLPPLDCEETARLLGERNIAVRAGLHCAPLAHESAGTLQTGTVRVSFGHDADHRQTGNLLFALEKILRGV